MKKSELFKQAQESVIRDPFMGAERKLEILRVLMSEEDIAKYVEERKEKQA